MQIFIFKQIKVHLKENENQIRKSKFGALFW